MDLNKGTAENPDVRCRLVAGDFKPKGDKDREDLFAAMPPLEAKKLLFRKVAGDKGRMVKGQVEKVKTMLTDVKKAHLNGVVGDEDQVFVQLPDEAGVPGMCGKLKR